MKSELAKIAKVLKSAGSFGVISHFNPDPDAVGSSCAVMLALKELGKKAVLLNETPVIKQYLFVPGYSTVSCDISLTACDALVICDCGSVSRAGDSFGDVVQEHSLVINIDHHGSNTEFGTFNLVNPGACSTCELIYDLLRYMEVNITPDIATALLTGIVGDTGSFRYSSTSARAHAVASELITLGADNALISNKLYGNRTLQSVRLEAYLLSNMIFHCENRIAEICAGAEVFRRFGAELHDADGIVESGRAVEGVRVSVFLREDGEVWRVSLRSDDPTINVSEVAARFGGGGHPTAAAFRSRLPLEEIRSKLLPLIEKKIPGV